ncbi:MAG: hypothetical protein WD136_00450, partial [Cyanobium sp.]
MTLLKAVTVRSAGAVLGAALLLAACGGEPSPDANSQAPPPPSSTGGSRPMPVAPSAQATSQAPLAGLTPLPTADQVVASVSSGRADPFAPLQTTSRPTGPRPALTLPQGLVFNGVIRSGGTPEAL